MKYQKNVLLKKCPFSWRVVTTMTSDWNLYREWWIHHWKVSRAINDKFRTRKFKAKIEFAQRARCNIFALNLFVQFIVYCTRNCKITSTNSYSKKFVKYEVRMDPMWTFMILFNFDTLSKYRRSIIGYRSISEWYSIKFQFAYFAWVHNWQNDLSSKDVFAVFLSKNIIKRKRQK